MKLLYKKLLPILVASLILPQLAKAQHTAAPDLALTGFNFAIGAGASLLNPDLGQTHYKLQQNTATAVRLGLGYMINPHWQVGISAASLGKAQLIGNNNLPATSAELDYRFLGLAGSWYPGANNGHKINGKLNWLLTAGVGQIDNSAKGVNYRRENNYSISFGAGLEYELNRNYSLLLLGESYDKDAALLSLSLVYANHRQAALKKATTKPAITPVMHLDKDGDGIIKANDCCPNTPADLEVNSRGCPVFTQLVYAVNFSHNSSALSHGAKLKLQKIAYIINAYPQMKIQLSGHTDSLGKAAYNLQLAAQRANKVQLFLSSQGVNPQQMRVESFGKAEPLYSNAHRGGRMKNRRVELFIVEHGMDVDGCPLNKAVAN